MKKVFYTSAILFLLIFSGCTKDYTDVDNLVDTIWRCSETNDIELEYIEFHFVSETKTKNVVKYFKDTETTEESLIDFISDEGQISFYYNSELVAIGTIEGTTMTFMFEYVSDFAYIFELQ